ncbi:MAG: hypothetical protein QNI96_05045 [Woeseiaceae bacterium]|nr:hypothetical protein [Woeseiaceae bacterium]
MTVESGSSIAQLDPNAPQDSEPLGESNEHIQRTKLALTYTFQGSNGDRYNETNGPVTVGPIALNRLPTDVGNIATEIGLNLDDVAADSRIDVIEQNAVRRDIEETITLSWAFNGPVAFSPANVPTVGDNDIATVNQIPSYRERSRLQVAPVTTTPYPVVEGDLGKKLNYTGTVAATITLGGIGEDTDLLFVTNANQAPSNPDSLVLTLTTSGFFLLPNNIAANTITITGRYKTVGLHKVGGNWQVSGAVDIA